jgi:hypothetical protein
MPGMIGMKGEAMLSQAPKTLATDGFCILPGLCDDEFVKHVLTVSQERIGTVREALGDREMGIGSAAGYDEIVQRSPGRWDLPITPQQFGVDDHDLPWWPVVAAVLGDDAEHSFSGIVFSDPDTPAQCWHTDSPHVATEHRPAHALNVLVALHDIPMVMGPTEFARGSQVLTNHLKNPSLGRDELIYQHATTSPELLVKGRDIPVPQSCASALARGTCVIFDDRILHRGLGNRSGEPRYVGYFSYRCQGYIENTHFEAARSVFDKAS